MVESETQVDLEKIVSLCKRRGFVFQSSEIYGGLASSWDYGPLGVEMERNVKDSWWRTFVWSRDDMVGLDAAILMRPETWRASGHVGSFSDPLVECKDCHRRFREDHLDGPTCPDCGGEFSAPRQFNLMFHTSIGSLSYAEEISSKIDSALSSMAESNEANSQPEQKKLLEELLRLQKSYIDSWVYLRPETAQGIFVNFNNVVTSTRKRLPFGIAQIGKAFRNEITTGNFIFRNLEFEIMEIEYFVKPGEDEEAHQRWMDDCMAWYTGLGVNPEKLRLRPHDADELSHYAKATYDIEYLYPGGWGEIMGIANRTDFDLKAHSEASGQTLNYFDQESGEHITPYVIEPSGGVGRAIMTFLVDAYTEEETISAAGKTETRVVMKLHPDLSPVKVAILPLSRNEKLNPLSREVFSTVQKSGRINGYVQFDDTQSIGRRYRRQDEIGTPLCVTVDFDSLDDKAVTIRDRDSMEQVRVPIDNLVDELVKMLAAYRS